MANHSHQLQQLLLLSVSAAVTAASKDIMLAAVCAALESLALAKADGGLLGDGLVLHLCEQHKHKHTYTCQVAQRKDAGPEFLTTHRLRRGATIVLSCTELSSASTSSAALQGGAALQAACTVFASAAGALHYMCAAASTRTFHTHTHKASTQDAASSHSHRQGWAQGRGLALALALALPRGWARAQGWAPAQARAPVKQAAASKQVEKHVGELPIQ
jgi:hypothetical protein